jgi:MFS transporter, DHA2 family, multidrug resistance protein
MQSTAAAPEQPVDPRRWRALAVLVVSLLVVVLDNTILNVALKTIQQDLGATQNQLIWAVNGYSLAFAALLFTWGVLGDRFGRRRVLVIGLLLFACASALCAFAASPAQLIAYRVLMGIGGASVLPVSLAILVVIFPPNERGRAIGIWAASVGAAVAIGPIAGGLLLDNPNLLNWLTGNDWGAVFFINVPVVIVGVIGILMLVPESRDPKPGKLDPQGLLLSVAGMLALVYGIQDAGWGMLRTYGWIALGLALLAVFVWYESRTRHPSIDLSLFRIRSFSLSLGTVALLFGALQGTILFLAFYYQIVRGWSPLQSGLLTLAFAVGQLISAPNSGRIVERVGARPVILTGLTIAAIGTIMVATLRVGSPVWYLLLMGFVFGLGIGATMAPTTTRMTLATPPARSGSGSAVQNTVRQLGGALGVAIISSVVASVYTHRIGPALANSPVPPGARPVAADSIGATYEAGAAVIQSGQAAPPQIAPLLNAANNAFLPAMHTAAYCSLGFIVVAIVLMSFLPRQAEAVAWTANAEHAADTVHSVPDAPAERPSAFANDGRQRQVLSWQRPDGS